MAKAQSHSIVGAEKSLRVETVFENDYTRANAKLNRLKHTHRLFREVHGMAMMQCRGCGMEVTSELQVCPKCKIALQDPVSWSVIFLIVVAAIVPYILYFWLFSR